MREPISEIFSMMLMLGTTSMEDVKAFRMELDKQACRTLAERADRAVMADKLALILEETPGDGGTQAIEVDARFHYELLQLPGNRMWMTIANAIFPVYRKGIKDTLIHASEEEQQRFSELHRAICEGIRAGSYEQCAQAIEEHYQLLV